MTPAQEEALRLFREMGSKAAVARHLGISEASVRERIQRAQAHEALPDGVRAAIEQTGTVGAARAGWRKIRNEDGSGESVYWRAPEPQDDLPSLVEALREGLADLRASPASVPASPQPANLMAVFPVADLHIGLKTDPEETGAAWDSKVAMRTFAGAFDRIVGVTPHAATAVLAQLGDLLHEDDQRQVTPLSGHQLDVDTRFFLVLRRAVAAMKEAIEALRRKYPRVIYRGCRGNHDTHAHHAVTLALAEFYRDVPDVEIVESATEFHVREFGVNLLVLHHGDRVKPDRLAHFIAAEYPSAWGRTRHRLALSGHIHHARAQEVGGLMCESVGTIIPRDAWARAAGYTARRALVSLTLHREDGEISRARVNV